jgi:hypothetical protein
LDVFVLVVGFLFGLAVAGINVTRVVGICVPEFEEFGVLGFDEFGVAGFSLDVEGVSLSMWYRGSVSQSRAFSVSEQSRAILEGSTGLVNVVRSDEAGFSFFVLDVGEVSLSMWCKGRVSESRDWRFGRDTREQRTKGNFNTQMRA